MIFKRILINNFGGLREKDIELTSGVNVLYGLKETEMNIVFIFVKSMFFGVPEEMNYMVSAQWKRLPPDAGNRGRNP